MKLIKASGSQFRLLIPGAVTTFFFSRSWHIPWWSVEHHQESRRNGTGLAHYEPKKCLVMHDNQPL